MGVCIGVGWWCDHPTNYSHHKCSRCNQVKCQQCSSAVQKPVPSLPESTSEMYSRTVIVFGRCVEIMANQGTECSTKCNRRERERERGAWMSILLCVAPTPICNSHSRAGAKTNSRQTQKLRRNAPAQVSGYLRGVTAGSSV